LEAQLEGKERLLDEAVICDDIRSQQLLYLRKGRKGLLKEDPKVLDQYSQYQQVIGKLSMLDYLAIRELVSSKAWAMAEIHVEQVAGVTRTQAHFWVIELMPKEAA
jgi:hypothetical protein